MGRGDNGGPLGVAGHPAQMADDGTFHPGPGIGAFRECGPESALVVGERPQPDLQVQLFLVREVVVDGSHADSGLLPNVRQPGAQDATAGEMALRHVEQQTLNRHIPNIVRSGSRGQ